MACSNRGQLSSIKCYVSQRIRGENVRPLARTLKISDEVIDQIEWKYKEDLKEFCYQVLTKWTQQKGNEATVEKLIETLREIERNDLADEVQEKIEPSTANEDALKATINELGVKQKELYKKIQLPQFPWTEKILPLDELFVELETIETDELGDVQKSKEIKLRQIFLPDGKDKRPKRMLIEGSPGYGKTTLALKILTDWSNGEQYLEHFKAAFMFQMRYFTEYDSIEAALKDECREFGVDEKKVMDYIRENQQDILLILDGFDELKDTEKQSLTSLIKKSELPNVCVVFTCRRGWYKEDTNSRNKSMGMAKNLLRSSGFLDKRILIKGIAEKNRKEFLLKYFNSDPKQLDDAWEFFRKTNTNLYESPLCLILLAFLAQDKQIKNIKPTKTSLFKFFFNSIFRNGLIRQNEIQDDETFDLFDPNPLENVRKYVDHFTRFGKLCLQHLLEDDLAFREDEVLDCVERENYFLNVGILTKCFTIGNRERREFHHPIHKTFLEFCAAFYFYFLSNDPEKREFEDEISASVENGIVLDSESLIYPFLAGLMNSSASLLFESLSPYSVYFQVGNSDTMSSILEEIDEIEFLMSDIVRFVPPVFDIRNHKDALHPNLIYLLCQKCNQQKMLLKLTMDISSAIDLFQRSDVEPLAVEEIDLYAKQLYSFRRFVIKNIDFLNFDKTFIRCSALNCVIESYDHGIQENNLDMTTLLISKIETKKINLHLESGKSNFNYILQILSIEKWKELLSFSLNLNFVCTEIYRKNLGEFVARLSELFGEKKVIEKFYLVADNLLDKSVIDEIWLVINRTSIDKFGLLTTHENISFDFNQLCKRKWKSLELDCCNFSDLSSLLFSVEQLAIGLLVENRDCSKQESCFIQKCQDLKYLFCGMETLQLLIEDRWPGLEFLLELHLFLPRRTPIKDYSQLLNLTTCSIDIENLLPDDSTINNLTSLAFHCPKLTTIEFFKFQNDSLLTPLFCHWSTFNSSARNVHHEENTAIESSIGKLRLRLEKLTIDTSFLFDLRVKLRDCVPFLRDFLRLKIIEKLSFVSAKKINLHPSLFPLAKDFRVFSEVIGPQDSRCQQHKLCHWYLERRIINPNKISVIYEEPK